MWNAIVKANCARAKSTASKPLNIAAIRRYPRAQTTTRDVTMVPLPSGNRRSTGSVQQACDGAVHLLILAFAIVLVDDFSALIDDVLRRPVLVAPGVPGRRIVVLGDRIDDAMPL